MADEVTSALRAKWDARYREAGANDREACGVLREFSHLLPAAGRALDLACGLGANALHLARRGLGVVAWDLSPVAVESLRARAAAAGMAVRAEVRDLVAQPPPHESFDVIVVSYFWEPRLCAVIMEALRPGGLLFYQTFVRAAVSTRGPSDSRYRLGTNELLHAFAPLQLVLYREEGRIGDTSAGLRDEAMLIARRIEGAG